jgi:type II secretory ATPase GspE/PulE/Tfp pilus assembly ATPase PilB-like protein
MIAGRNVVAKHRTISGGEAADPEQSAPQVLERLVEKAERAGASDIHLHMRAGCRVGRLPPRWRDDTHG